MASDTSRAEIVDRARELWIEKLIDTTRRNNLLYYRDLKAGTLDITGCGEDNLQRLLEGSTLSIERLAPASNDKRSSAILREIGRRALANLEEKGLSTLFLAVGMATWQPEDEGRPPAAPVLLMPIEVVSRGRAGGELEIRRSGETQINPVLLHVLDVDYGYHLDPERLMEDSREEEEGAAGIDPQAVFTRMREAVPKVRGFSVRQRVVVGNFSFQKMAMVQDLRLNAAAIVSHDIIAGMAGDLEAATGLQGSSHDVDLKEFDQQFPDRELLILDADSSQQTVIEAVQRGQNCVIQGPPGTGKSQTISNLIAGLASQGKRILFVAEKRAALEVVLRRLQGAGLGHLALDLHGADQSRKEILKRVAESLESIQRMESVDGQELYSSLHTRRARLNDYVRALHAKRVPSGLSVYDIQGRLLRLPKGVHSSLRWRGPDLIRIDASAARKVMDLLKEAAGVSGLITGEDPSPWTGAKLDDPGAVQRAVDLSLSVEGRWPKIFHMVQSLMNTAKFAAPTTFAELASMVRLLSSVSATMALYEPEIWNQELGQLSKTLSPAARPGLAGAWASLTNLRYRSALRTVRAIRRSKAGTPRTILSEITAARDQLRDWRSHDGDQGVPMLIPDIDTAWRLLTEFQQDLGKLELLLTSGDLTDSSLGRLEQRLRDLSEDSATPYRLPRVYEIERELDELGAGAVVEEIRRSKPRPELWPQVFEYAWLTSYLDLARSTEAVLASFSRQTHDQTVEEFRRLDRERLQLAAARVRRLHAEHTVSTMNAHPDQTVVVRHEAQKRARHKPIRKLLAEAPDVLLALFPCWMASPLSVSQLISADRKYFDVVLFDEASQVLPEDAVPAILRGTGVAVAGDRHQLPPTMFFVDGSNEEDLGSEDASMAEGFESLLDQLSSFLPTRMLEWHYRSRDESLIAFSNRHIYNERLVTFPGPGGADPAVSHVLVPHVMGQDGQEESARNEVRRVAELVLEHASTHPGETLGVIAMGIKHARQVEAAIDEALRSRPELDAFFDESREERFFVKNLERVQGDERDAIILTVGYGKDRAGHLPHRFGPLLTAGGERRLNVAITRARRRMTVVSSFDHRDVDTARSRARGVELLKLFLEFASSQGKRLGETQESAVPMNAFEEDVYHALEREGIGLIPQLGASRYRIDFVAKHPERPGDYVLAIECDGATYHSAPTARDRDRLRQQHLEALGWRFHRIWSTDWFARRDVEIRRAVEAYREALQPSSEGGRPSPSRHEESSRSAQPITKPKARERRPRVPVRDKIDEYQTYELQALVDWIRSDGLLRTNDEIVDEMVVELGFKRRGSRIEGAIMRAILTTSSGGM